MKLLHFIESKGPAGFQLFLKAIANEVDEPDQLRLQLIQGSEFGLEKKVKHQSLNQLIHCVLTGAICQHN